MSKTVESNWVSCLIYILLTACTILLVLTCYKFVQRRRSTSSSSSRRNARRHRVPEEDDVHESSSQMQSVGLASAVIHSLPTIQFKKGTDKVSVDDDNVDCAVCLAGFKEEEWLRYLPSCAHLFHAPCIDAWLLSHTTCPLCRADVLDGFNSYDCSASPDAPVETSRREDACRERPPQGRRLLDSFMMEAMGSNPAETDSDDSVPAVSPMMGPKGNTRNDLLDGNLKCKGESSTGDRTVQASSSLG